MTTEQNHPITPPLELLKHWEDQHFDEGENYDVMLIQAYQAGADRELEACCEWIPKATPWDADQLRAARRPQPPSLKQQALEELNKLLEIARSQGVFNPPDTIRRALEQLND